MSGRDRHFHEQLLRYEPVKVATNRSFGLTFAAIGAVIGLIRLWSGGASAPYWLSAAVAFLGTALLAPAILAPLNRLWLRFGVLLYRVVNPMVMALLFFIVLTPVALAMRWLSKRPLKLKAEPAATTYWVERRPPGPPPATMNRQF